MTSEKNMASELIDKFREKKPDINLGENTFVSRLFQNSYSRDCIYEDEGFSETYTSWSNNLEPRFKDIDGDHFCIDCSECDNEADIIQVELFGGKSDPQVRFHIYCNECNKVGSKKIYLKGSTRLKSQED